jgi:hypothetical protein
MPARARTIGPYAVLGGVLAVGLYQLHSQGRSWLCRCGEVRLWVGQTWSAENSQQLFDPYSFTHLLHGLIFCGLLAWLAPRWPLPWKLCCAVAFEVLWEVVENTGFIIERYREVTLAVGYEGDTVLNSLGDILSFGVGFIVARRLGFLRSAVLFALTELALALWIRDGLLLNVIMLVHPMEAIKAWQLVH